MSTSRRTLFAAAAGFPLAQTTLPANAPAILRYDLGLTVIHEGWDGNKCYVHSRAGAIPPFTGGNQSRFPIIVMTTQKHFVRGNDIFDGLEDFRSSDIGRSWQGPVPHAGLQRRRMGPGIEVAPCDFTPQWHAATARLLGTGKTFWYKDNKQYRDSPSDPIYAVYDPRRRTWSAWQPIKLPALPQFKNCSAGCTQRFDLPSGDVLLPVYFRPQPAITDHRVTVLRCGFDGQTLRYLQHGDELELEQKQGDGLSEPSLTRFQGRFYLTLRTVARAYVTTSEDGLHYEPLRPWRFDDGQELGSYNTQQHWVTHSEGLFLVYTRRGVNNDHVFRHRAPLLIARVDPQKRVVLRDTEQVIVPETGTRMGNFGVVHISPLETWVITTEWMQQPPPGGFEKYGSNNRIFCAKIKWNRVNRS